MSERTVTEHVRPSVAGTGLPPALGLVMTPARAGAPPGVVDLPRPVTTGRGDAADLVLEDPGASRLHARFERRGEAVLVSDLGSRNGTWVDGAQVGKSGALVGPGAVVRVGRTLFVVADVAPYGRPRPAELPGLIGGASLDEARDSVLTIAPTRSPVLVLGETGTGKEVIAGLVHQYSGRTGPFVALNCAAVPSELVDAELFGHARGAFSGATRERTGLFRTASGGTLFLDEIGEMPAPVQAKLLRTLETGEVRPVGDDQSLTVDTRVVAATNRDVDQLIDSGSFRGDLLHRLAGLRVRLPPLRERREDVPILARSFAAGASAEVATVALELLALHPWPGNVRELRNVVAAAAEVARRRGRSEIAEEDVLPLLVRASSKSAPPGRAEQEQRRIADALTQASGDVAEAASLLGMGRSALYEALRRLNIDPRPYRQR
ncbi:MAG: sigma 54-interacting transcriptional regulator [Myxococcales bacterium]|nr:sigma 54-interacting transcriptional regulator [Myxococcales bacterium]